MLDTITREATGIVYPVLIASRRITDDVNIKSLLDGTTIVIEGSLGQCGLTMVQRRVLPSLCYFLECNAIRAQQQIKNPKIFLKLILHTLL
jgi:hypothetical protein